MTYRDLLLPAVTYPDATPDSALRSGVALARRLGGDLTLLTVRVDIPDLNNALADALLQIDQMVKVVEARSQATAELEAVCARVAAEESGVAIRTTSVTAKLSLEAELVAQRARTHDLTLLPIGPAVLADQHLAETVLFGSGRPVLVYPDAAAITPRDGFERVAIAWDGGSRAARAVADALPLLTRAREVRIFVGVGEKPQVVAGSARDLIRHLAAHGVDAALDERPAPGAAIDKRIAAYVAEAAPDLLVMGGFGHTRLREFILGGATQAVIEAPPCPVLMSH